MKRRSTSLFTLCALLMATSACVTNRVGEPGSVTPDVEGEHAHQPEGWNEGDSRDELEARLKRLVEQQKGLHAAAGANAGACEDICSLATSICGVQEKLCSIADRHPGDEEYQGLCRESKQECRAAQDDCISCVETHAKGDAESAGTSPTEPATKPEAPAEKPAAEAKAAEQ